MAIHSINEELCTGCGICVASCPMDVIRMDQVMGKAVVKYVKDCMVCFNCERDCPEEGAIYVSPERARAIPLPW